MKRIDKGNEGVLFLFEYHGAICRLAHRKGEWMEYASVLQIPRGVTAIIGGGGKTSLLLRLGRELSAQARVVLCATAKMFPPEGVLLLDKPDAASLEAALQAHRLVCVGADAGQGKITLPEAQLALLLAAAEYVLVEADGSRGLPLKAHAAHEPVIPANAARVVSVLGVDGIGQTIASAAHRPTLYAALLHTDLAHIITPADAAAVIEAEGYGDIVYMNKAETIAGQRVAREIARQLRRPSCAGSLQEGNKPLCLS